MVLHVEVYPPLTYFILEMLIVTIPIGKMAFNQPYRVMSRLLILNIMLNQVACIFTLMLPITLIIISFNLYGLHDGQ
jgi:hypothetical protein